MTSSMVKKSHKTLIFKPKIVKRFFLGSSTVFLLIFEETIPRPPANLADISVIYDVDKIMVYGVECSSGS